MTDPSWLYSTIAQSSAAIVAIIGGFITHSILSLRAEKMSLLNQLNGKKAELQGFNKTFKLERKDRLTEEELRDLKKSAESRQIKVESLKAEINSLETRLKYFS